MGCNYYYCNRPDINEIQEEIKTEINNKESNKINNINKQKTKGKLLGNNLKELRLNNTTNSIENEKIEQEKNKIKNNLQLLDEKKISYKKETYELMLKLKNDLAFYLSQDKWDIIEKKKIK